MGISCELALKRRRKKERKMHQPSHLRLHQVTQGTFSNLRQPASFQWSVRPSVFGLLFQAGFCCRLALETLLRSEVKSIPPWVRGWTEWE